MHCKGNNLIVILVLFFLSVGKDGITQDLPAVVPPSPEASAFFRYQDYPVDYSTGLPQINIPLYEIKSGDLSVPISINYHSSGRKVYDETGALGLGWTLMAGGMISRTIYGDADDNDALIKFPWPWKKQNSINYQTDAGFLAAIDNDNSENAPKFDTEYDVFSFMVNSISGKFVLRDINNVKSPVLIPKKPYKIECHQYTASSNLKYFDFITITDDKGVVYKFGPDAESSSSGGMYAPTGWLLNSITSADQTATINFKYTAFSKSRKTISQKTIITDQWKNCICHSPDTDPNEISEYTKEEENTTNQDYSIKRLTEINFNEGKIVFNLQGSTDIISSMQVYNSSNEILRTIEFTQESLDMLSDGNQPTKKLTSLFFKNPSGVKGESYLFEYYPTIYSGQAYVNPRFADMWGYYNASGQNNMRPYITNIPLVGFTTTTINIGNPSASRSPSLEATKSGVLKKITFPTGGTTEYFYENNRFKDDVTQVVKDGGGLRLSKTTTSAGLVTSFKTYKYGINETGYGSLPLIPDASYMFYTNQIIKYCVSNITAPDLTYRTRTYFADVVPLFSYFAQRPIIYQEVAEYIGSETNTIGKTLYRYDYDGEIAPKGIPNLFTGRDYNYWRISSLTDKIDYKNINGVYSQVKSVHHNYSETQYEDEKLWGLHVQRIYLTSPSLVLDAPGGTGLNIPSYKFASTKSSPCNGISNGPFKVFDYGDYSISVGKKELGSTVYTDYSDVGDLTTTKTYDYNSNHLLSHSTVKNSKEGILSTDFKYPFDYTGNSVLTQMVSLNMLNFPVEQIEFSNSLHKKSIRTEYFNWSPTRIAPKTVEVKNGAGAYEVRIRYSDYDSKGNVKTVLKENDIPNSYIWDYNSAYPVAEVTNASQSDIAYTSFEADGKGNWTFSGTPVSDLASPTGKKMFTIVNSTNNITKNGLSTTATYIVSYWKKSGTVAVNGTTPVTGKTINGWTYNEHKVVNPSGGLVTVSGTNGIIDELRLYPANALMTTYTYVPLKGLTNQCDINNRITYYEYDGFGRLMLVQDQDKNIIKKICYNYAGQPENCPPFANIAKSGNFKRNNCTGCQVGSSVDYPVAAGTYISNISQAYVDQQAQDDINANGQAYANSHGTCGAPPIAGANAMSSISSNVSISLTNSCTGTNYNYTLNAYSNASFGPFPSGTYNVYMSSSGTHTYIINGYSQTSSSSANFYGVVINGGASIQVIN